MKSSLQSAARGLLREVAVAPGAVNVIALPKPYGPVIKVFVHPNWRHVVSRIPAKYRGYRVSVEIA